jgi:uncharacterized protein (DUF1697 family)
MTRYVAFLRAINVGSHLVKMDRLRAIFEAIGVSNVSTFIASGNVLFDTKKSPAPLEAIVEKTLRAELGYEVATMIRRLDEVSAVVSHVEKQKLVPEAGVMLYVGFLKATPTAAAAQSVAAMSNDIDTLAVHQRELYWRCRKTFSQSTVTGAKLEKLLGVPATVRNFTTVQRLASRTDVPRVGRAHP